MANIKKTQETESYSHMNSTLFFSSLRFGDEIENLSVSEGHMKRCAVFVKRTGDEIEVTNTRGRFWTYNYFDVPNLQVISNILD